MTIDNMAVTADKCMATIRDHVGTVELETFIYYIRSQAFDYTKWQRKHYEAIAPDELYSEIEEHSRKHPFRGKKATVI